MTSSYFQISIFTLVSSQSSERSGYDRATIHPLGAMHGHRAKTSSDTSLLTSINRHLHMNSDFKEVNTKLQASGVIRLFCTHGRSNMIEHLENTDAKVSFPTDVYADMRLYREYSVIITNGNDQLSCWLRIMYYVNITRLLAQV